MVWRASQDDVPAVCSHGRQHPFGELISKPQEFVLGDAVGVKWSGTFFGCINFGLAVS